MKKLLFLVILCLTAVMFFWCSAASAVSVEKSPAVICESAECFAGESVTVNVNIENNPGIMYLELTPEFDSALGEFSIENGEIFSDFTNGVQYIWKAGNDVEKNGRLMSLTFNTSKNTAAGDYKVGFIFRSAYKYTEETAKFTVSYATVHIKTPVKTDCTVVCENKECKAGKEVSFDINITNNPGIMYLELTPEFDSALGEFSVENGDVFPDFFGELQYIWKNSKDINTNGRLATVSFTVPESTPAGEYSISFAFRSAYNYNEKAVDVTVVPAHITVKDTFDISADINSDGKTDVSDCVCISMFLAGKLNLNDFQLAVADVDGIKGVTQSDADYLAEYIVGIKNTTN